MANEQRVYLSKSDALNLIGKRDPVHVFLNPNGMLVGADWSMEEIDKLLSEATLIEVGGNYCVSMGHPVVAIKEGRPHFIEAKLTDEIKLRAGIKTDGE